MTNDEKETAVKDQTCWKRLSALERGLMVITVFMALLCITLVIGIGAIVMNFTLLDTSETAGNICVTPACIHTASEILHNMDKKVDPCNNFYQFACGGFLKETSIPDDELSVNEFQTIRIRIQEQLRKSISEPIKDDDRKPVRLVKNLYKSCMNTTAIEDQGLEPLLEILKKLGGWPVLEGAAWNETKFSWMESVYKFRDEGYSVNYFIEFSINDDFKNSTKHIITLDQPSTVLAREFFIEGKNFGKLISYRKYMMAIALKLNASEENAKKELKDVLNFEKEIANISLPKEKQRDSTLLYNPMTISELSAKYPSIPWIEYFNRLLAPKVTIDHDEIINVANPDYVAAFMKLIKKTPPRTQANYVMWRAVEDTIKYLNQDLRNEKLKYFIKNREPRWRECIEIVTKKLSLSVGALYIRKHFSRDAKRNVVEIIDNIRNEFNEMLKKVDWLDKDTRKSALDKAASMYTHIAYPDELLDDEKLENYYNSLELNDGNYLKSILNITLFDTEYSFGELRKPYNVSDWTNQVSAATVNAYYWFSKNSIELPAAILQGHIFNNERPKYVNYGTMGSIIGHEITHGFDDQGRQFDKNGNLIDWWAPSTKEKYLRKAECIINQYDNYTVTEVGLNLNGINTQGENIADNGGFKVAYLAYKTWLSKNGNEQTLPGLNFTPRQLFWLSAANMWCSKTQPDGLKSQIFEGEHSPNEFRVLGSFSNIVDFAKDFNCQEGSGMNPKKKCDVW